MEATTRNEMMERLKSAITTQADLEYIGKELWFIHFSKLIKIKFPIDLACKIASELAYKQVNSIFKAHE